MGIYINKVQQVPLPLDIIQDEDAPALETASRCWKKKKNKKEKRSVVVDSPILFCNYRRICTFFILPLFPGYMGPCLPSFGIDKVA